MGKEERIKILTDILQGIQEDIRELCSALGLPDLSNLRYETLVASESRVKRRGKTYRYIQLKGSIYTYGEQTLKTQTIKTWKSPGPLLQINRLIRLYRGACHINRALDQLFMT